MSLYKWFDNPLDLINIKDCNVLIELHKIDAAIESFYRAIKIKHNFAEAHYNRGKALKDLWQLDEAVASYDKAIQLKPDLTEAFNNRGTAQKTIQKTTSTEKCERIKPDNRFCGI